VPGEFDCAIAVNFFQHIPTSRQDLFLDALQRKLAPGSQVLIAINRLHRVTRSRFYRKPGEADLFDLRLLPDGTVHEIVDNVFNQADLACIFQSRSTHWNFHRGAKFDWISYTTSGSSSRAK
jgi:cyclopropane fatty-acyl-phospholipid synthase-like methyltransferase